MLFLPLSGWTRPFHLRWITGADWPANGSSSNGSSSGQAKSGAARN